MLFYVAYFIIFQYPPLGGPTRWMIFFCFNLAMLFSMAVSTMPTVRDNTFIVTSGVTAIISSIFISLLLRGEFISVFHHTSISGHKSLHLSPHLSVSLPVSFTYSLTSVLSNSRVISGVVLLYSSQLLSIFSNPKPAFSASFTIRKHLVIIGFRGMERSLALSSSTGFGNPPGLRNSIWFSNIRTRACTGEK